MRIKTQLLQGLSDLPSKVSSPVSLFALHQAPATLLLSTPRPCYLMPASGPLHLLFLLFTKFFPKMCVCLPPSQPSNLNSKITSSRSLPSNKVACPVTIILFFYLKLYHLFTVFTGPLLAFLCYNENSSSVGTILFSFMSSAPRIMPDAL